MTAAERISRVVTGVVRQALLDAGARTLVLLDDGSPEAGLVHDWCAAALGATFLTRVRGDAIVRELARAPASHDAPDLRRLEPEALAEEARRLEARLLARAHGALVASPANKTALLLAPAGPPDPLLPLGDLYATDVLELAGAWSAPGPVRALAEMAGGIAALDDVLRARFDQRRSLGQATAGLAPDARAAIGEALEAGRFARRRVGIVPKLGPRTLGLDLFD